MKTSIFDIDNWTEIGATLARNKTRTFLTAFGIFWGVAMLAMLWGGAIGLKDMLMRNFDGFATNTAVLFPGRTTMSYKGFNKGTQYDLVQADADGIRNTIPEVVAQTSVYNIGVTASYGKNSTSTTIMGVDADYPEIMLPVIYSGRFINASDSQQERKVCVIGKKVADEIFGYESPIGKYVKVSGIYFYVVGVAGQTSEVQIGSKIDEAILIPSTTMRRSFNLGDDIGGLMMKVKDGVSPTSLKPRIARILRRNHPIHPDDDNAIGFWDISQQFEMVDSLFLGIMVLALFVGVGSLLAGIIGIGNIMWVIVKERTQEIGIRRAIGAKPLDIITQILSEGVVLTFVAGIAGICFATIVLFIAQKLTANEVSTPHFQLYFSQAVTIMVTFMILGTAAGLIPALKTMKIKPIEAMNDK